MSFIDFAELKARCSIEQAAKLLANHRRASAVANALPGLWRRAAGDRHHLRESLFNCFPGVLAPVGMIVRNLLILVNQIDTEIAHGRAPWDAVIEATLHSFRPILLTAAAALLGMIPIAPTVFWGPMAYSIMGGLAVATMLTLVFLPALYVAWFRIKEPSARDVDSVGRSDYSPELQNIDQ